MIVYHRTAPEAARQIVATRRWQSTDRYGYVYFSNNITGQAEGYGEAVVYADVPRELLMLDDEFPGGEKHYCIAAHHLAGLRVGLVAE